MDVRKRDFPEAASGGLARDRSRGPSEWLVEVPRELSGFKVGPRRGGRLKGFRVSGLGFRV